MPEQTVSHQRNDDRFRPAHAPRAHLSYIGDRIGIAEPLVPAAPAQLAHTGTHCHHGSIVPDRHTGPISDHSPGNTADCWNKRPAGDHRILDRTGPDSQGRLDHKRCADCHNLPVAIGIVPLDIGPDGHCMPSRQGSQSIGLRVSVKGLEQDWTPV